VRRRQPPPPCGSTASRLCHVPVSVRTPQREADGRSGGTVTFPPAHPQPRGRSGSDGLRVWTPIVFAERRFDAVPAFPPRVGVRTDGDRRVVAELICSTASMSRAMYATWQRPTTRQGRWTVSPCLLACLRPTLRPRAEADKTEGRRPETVQRPLQSNATPASPARTSPRSGTRRSGPLGRRPTRGPHRTPARPRRLERLPHVHRARTRPLALRPYVSALRHEVKATLDEELAHAKDGVAPSSRDALCLGLPGALKALGKECCYARRGALSASGPALSQKPQRSSAAAVRLKAPRGGHL